MHNQTPRHSSTKHIKKQGTINSKVEHWDYTTWGLIWDDIKKRKERTSKYATKPLDIQVPSI